MTEPAPTCPDCGTALPPDSPQALCPACLLRQALASRTIVPEGEKPGAVPPPSPEEIADKFPQFEITECLGRGGMGVVYKARQKSLDRWVAIKILAPERVGQEKFADRFEREAKTLAKMSHPNIVTVFDHGRISSQLSTLNSQPTYYIVMEFVDGVNLRDLLRDGKIEPKQALAIVPPICDALQYAHEKGIVHRDIKPENLLLDREGRVKIADFGIAALVGADGESAGTPPYMAPEQTESLRDVDSRADIYALGVVLYEMLTGERPAKDVIAPSRKVEIDVRLDKIVLRALEKKPELRYQEASDFKTMVETIAAEPVSAHGAGSTPAGGVVSRAPGDKPTRETARQSVHAPAICLLFAAALNLLGGIVFPVFLVPLNMLASAMAGPAGLLLTSVLYLVATVLIVVGALLMRRLRGYGVAFIGCIFAMILPPGLILGLPIGIWGLFVLCQKDVREAFEPYWRRGSLIKTGSVLLGVTCIIVIATGVISSKWPPTYEAASTVLVNDLENRFEKAQELALAVPGPGDEADLTVKEVAGGKVIRVSARSGDPQVAADAANAAGSRVVEGLAKASDDGPTWIVNKASVPQAPVSPNTLAVTLFALCLTLPLLAFPGALILLVGLLRWETTEPVSTAEGRNPGSLPEKPSTTLGNWALGIFLFALLLGLSGAGRTLFTPAALVLSLVLGLMSWRTQSGKVASIASGIVMLLIGFYSLWYFTPKYGPEGISPSVKVRKQAEESLAATRAMLDANRPASMDDVLAVLGTQGEAAAANAFLETEWSRRPLFRPGSLLSLTEDQFAALPEDERNEKSTELSTRTRELRLVTSAVQRIGREAVAQGDFDKAEECFESLKCCGRALDEPGDLLVVRLLGQAIEKNANEELSKLPGESSLAFGQVVEREIRVDERTIVTGLKFGDGELLTLTREEFDRTADDGTDRRLYRNVGEWCERMNLDLVVGGNGKSFGLAGLDKKFTFGSLPAEAWDHVTDAELNGAIETAEMDHKEFWNRVMIPDDAPIPQTYAIKSGDTIGLLQITKRWQNPDGITFRYKLAQKPVPQTDTSPVIPKIRFENVVLTEALGFFRANWPINYAFDAAVTDAQKAFQFSAQWDGLTARQAMTAALDIAGLQLVENPDTGVARIANKPDTAPDGNLVPYGQGKPDTSPVIPKMIFEDATLLEALEFIRIHWPINYVFDSAVTDEQKSAPSLTLNWENLPAQQAMTAVLESCGLQLVDDPRTSVARIINRPRAADAEFGIQKPREYLLEADGANVSDVDHEDHWYPWAEYMKRGDMARFQRDLPGALENYRKSLSAAEAAVNRKPDRALYRRNLASSHRKIGDVLSAQGEFEEALASYRNALAILEKLDRDDADNTDWENETRSLHVKIGDVLRARGDKAGALSSYRAALSVTSGTPRITDWSKAFSYLPIDYKPTEPFDPNELRRLADQPLEANNSDGYDLRRRLFHLIRRAGAEKDGSFRDLLEREDLRKDEGLDLAVAGYDYSVNGNQNALDYLLAKLAREEVGSDSSVVAVLDYVDEWKETTDAVKAHFTATDGAGGIAKGAFWLTRQYLFPRRYLEYLGKAGEGAPVPAVESAVIAISGDGMVTFAGVPCQVEQLRAKLLAPGGSVPPGIEVSADQGAKFELVTRVIDACKAAGVVDIRFKQDRQREGEVLTLPADSAEADETAKSDANVSELRFYCYDSPAENSWKSAWPETFEEALSNPVHHEVDEHGEGVAWRVAHWLEVHDPPIQGDSVGVPGAFEFHATAHLAVVREFWTYERDENGRLRKKDWMRRTVAHITAGGTGNEAPILRASAWLDAKSEVQSDRDFNTAATATHYSPTKITWKGEPIGVIDLKWIAKGQWLKSYGTWTDPGKVDATQTYARYLNWAFLTAEKDTVFDKRPAYRWPGSRPDFKLPPSDTGDSKAISGV